MTKVKFTATLVHEADKNTIVTLRDSIKLSEKDTMALIVKFAMQHELEIREIAEQKVAEETEQREERRKANYELLKQKMKEARQAAKAEKVGTKAEPEKVEA